MLPRLAGGGDGVEAVRSEEARPAAIVAAAVAFADAVAASMAAAAAPATVFFTATKSSESACADSERVQTISVFPCFSGAGLSAAGQHDP